MGRLVKFHNRTNEEIQKHFCRRFNSHMGKMLKALPGYIPMYGTGIDRYNYFHLWDINDSGDIFSTDIATVRYMFFNSESYELIIGDKEGYHVLMFCAVGNPNEIHYVGSHSHTDINSYADVYEFN